MNHRLCKHQQFVRKHKLFVHKQELFVRKHKSFVRNLPLVLIFLSIFGLFQVSDGLASVGFDISEAFSLDTRENLPPDGPWQILTNKGNSFNEDLVIDDFGKVWAFYLHETGSGQPVYMKILRSTGYTYRSEESVCNATSILSPEKQVIRACHNPYSDDVWLAVQGDQAGVGKGFFIIFDSTGVKKGDKVYLPGEAGVYYPKMACDQAGNMWFIWQSDSVGSGTSIPEYACYDRDGNKIYGPTSVRSVGPTTSTDIVVDKLNRIWFIYERGGTHLFTRIINAADQSEFQVEYKRSQVESVTPFNHQRIAFSDTVNNRVILLVKNSALAQQKIKIFDLDGDELAEISNVGNVNFLTNELNRLEIIQHAGSFYRKGEFSSTNGKVISDPRWLNHFSGVYSFVRNGLAYNSNFGALKAYLVQVDSNITRFYLEQIVDAPDIGANPKFVDFGSVRILSQKQEPVLIENRGTAVLNITNIISNESQFTVDKTSFSLNPGAHDWLGVTFAPTAIGNVSGKLTLMNNDPDSSMFEIPLQAEGRDYLPQKIVLNSDTLFFGTVPTSSYQKRSLSITNTGEYALQIDSLQFFHANFFAEKDTLRVGPNLTRELEVIFRPSAAESTKSVVKIYHNDVSTGGTSYVELVGAGRAPSVQKIFVGIDSLSFGDVAIDEVLTRTITVVNEGESPLKITNVQSSDTMFYPVEQSFTVGAGESYEMGVTFDPPEVGNFTANLTIANNDETSPEVLVKLAGVGRKINKPDIRVEADSIYFAGVLVGGNRTNSFRIWNIGDRLLSVSNITTTNPAFTVSPTIFSLQSDESQWIEVSYKADTLKTDRGSMSIISNDPDSDTLKVGLEGFGVDVNPPQISVKPMEVNYDTVATNDSLTRWVEISNLGGESLEISKIFTTTHVFKCKNENLRLGSNETHWLQVKFIPIGVQLVEGKLVVVSNDQGNDSLEVRLLGVGREPQTQKIFVANAELDFGTIGVGNSETRNIMVKNSGELKLIIDDVVSDNDQFKCAVTNLTLEPQATAWLPVVFTPVSVGGGTANLTINSNDPNNATLNVTVRGNGRGLYPANIELSQGQLNFASVAVGHEVVQRSI